MPPSKKLKIGGELLEPQPPVQEPVAPPAPAPEESNFSSTVIRETNVNNDQDTPSTSSTVVSLFSNKNFWIAMLVVMLILSFLGVNLVLVFGQIFQPIVNVFWILISQILSLFGYTTGTVLNKTVDVVSGTAKAGIDIAEGTVQSVGNLLIKGSSSDVPSSTQAQISANILGGTPSPAPLASSPSPPTTTTTTTTIQRVAPSSTLDQVLNSAKNVGLPAEPKPDSSSSAIQASSAWCFVGEMNGQRTCANVSSSNLCLSGQVYKTKSECQSDGGEGFATRGNGPLMMATPLPQPRIQEPFVQAAPTGAVPLVQLPELGPPQMMGPPNFAPPGMTQVQMQQQQSVPTVGDPLMNTGPPNFLQISSHQR